MDKTIKIKAETEGFEEAMESVEALATAYDGFSAQVTIKNCKECTINIYPSQTKIMSCGADVRGE